MSNADTAEYWIDELVKALNKLGRDAESAQYSAALDDIAEEMGIAIQKVYTR